MSSVLRELRALNVGGTRVLWFGHIASAPSDLSDMIDVVVPDFDPTVKWTDCRWQARSDTAMPSIGDECLIALDNRDNPWVMAWWPF